MPNRTSRSFRRAAWVMVFAVAVARMMAANEAPPAFADGKVLVNGCYLSAVRYMERFAAEFPAERVERVVVDNWTGFTRHSVAVVTWNGKWWVRDDRLGVVELPFADSANVRTPEFEKAVTKVLVRKAREFYRREAGRRAAAEASDLTVERRTENVVAAAVTMPGSEVFWVRDGANEVPVLVFHPRAGSVGVYDPAFGSAVIETDANAARVVHAVAAKLGYKVTAVRAATPAAAVVVAAR